MDVRMQVAALIEHLSRQGWVSAGYFKEQLPDRSTLGSIDLYCLGAHDLAQCRIEIYFHILLRSVYIVQSLFAIATVTAALAMAMRLLNAGWEYKSNSTQGSGSASARFWLARRGNAEA